MTKRQKVTAYIRSLRNDEKRHYAGQYLGWLMGPADEPEPEKGSLSYMAAQAVRMNVNQLWQAAEEADFVRAFTENKYGELA